MNKKKVGKFIWAVWFALGHYALTAIIFNSLARQSLMAVTVLNFALIVFFLVLEKVENSLVFKLKASEQKSKPSFYKKILIAYLGGISFKTALYLFYIFILVCSGINAVEPGFFGEVFKDYLLTVEYGILVLVAADSFLNQLFKDVSER